MRWTVNVEGGPKRVNHAACAVGDKIYMFGGYSAGESHTFNTAIDVFALDTETYRWTRLSDEPTFKKQPKTSVSSSYFSMEADEYEMSDTDESLTASESGLQQAAYEDEGHDVDVDYDWQYNPLANPEAAETDERDYAKETPYMRYGHTVVTFNGRIYLWGGRNDEYGASKRLYEYNPGGNSWTAIDVEGFVPPARDGHSAVVYGHSMIVFGGYEEENQRFSQETFVYDFHLRQWRQLETTGTAPPHRDFHAACVLGDQMFVFGGRCDERGQYHSNIDYYDDALYALNLRTAEWSVIETKGDRPLGRRSNTLWSHNDLMYMFGGYESKTDKHFSDLRRYDPLTQEWAKIKPAGFTAPRERRRQCSVMVGNRLFLFGGTRPHDLRKNFLLDLGDLHVLDYENSLMSICMDTVIRTGLYKHCEEYIPDFMMEDIQMMTTPNTISRLPRNHLSG